MPLSSVQPRCGSVIRLSPLVYVVLFGAISASVTAESLYSETTYAPLTQDQRAYRVGQVLTVLIFEEATASTSADTATNKNLDFRGEVEGINNGMTDRFGANLGLDNEFAGGGTIERAGRLVGRVTANIERQLPTGEYYIRGQQRITFNEDSQVISVAGTVRPVDINRDNTVFSFRIANAEIVYSGDGILRDRQQPGAISRLLNWLF